MLRFVLATIQQRLEACPDIVKDFEDNGSQSKYAFGAKAAGLAYIADKAEQIHYEASQSDALGLLETFAKIPGIGMVKAGFAAQMFAGLVGCIDTHNIKMYDVPMSALKYNKNIKSADIKRKKLSAYARLCEDLGGSVNLWAAWCNYKGALSEAEGKDFDGYQVSKIHVDIVLGRI
jgi:hypothetical protein